MWNLSIACKSLIMQLMDHEPENRPSPCSILIGNWIGNTSKIINEIKHKIDREMIINKIQKMKFIYKMSILDRAICKSCFKLSKSTNEQELKELFLFLDND